MRVVNHLLGVEFIHDLYNRHAPRINFIRFRNTITIWKEGIVNSFAPEKDFNTLEKWLGEKFFNLDKTLIKQFSILLNSDRNFFNQQISRFRKTRLDKLSGKELGLLLTDIQQYSLGELYKMNFVQAEYSLTAAIKRILREIYKDENKINEVFSKIIATNTLTESEKEELQFSKILKNKKGKSDIIPKDIYKKIDSHYKKYAFMHSAYGADPYDINYYLNKYKNFDPKVHIQTLIETRKKAHKNYSEGRKILQKINNKKLNVLIPLMILGGTFRDKNKASLGYTIEFKHKVLDEISRRKIEDRSNLNYYLLSEILSLLDENIRLEQEIIKGRQKEGVILVRSEYMDQVINFKPMDLLLPNQSNDTKDRELQGKCACSGQIKGTVKIVFKKEDGLKIEKGDIMVAIGTDFDLMDAIHRSAGIITEEGGLLSHASVVCREMNKTCLIGVKNATKILKDGDKILLDSKHGKVVIL